MQPEVDFSKIGKRIRAARLERGLSQEQLGEMIGCSNNHMSHVEVGQTKISLTMLMRLSVALDKDFDYFLLDTPFVRRERIINSEIMLKLEKCNPSTLITINKIIDVLLNQQDMLDNEYAYQ